MGAFICILEIVGLRLRRWRGSGQPLASFLAIGLVRLYVRVWHRWSLRGPGRMPAPGPAIVVANHTYGADCAFVTATRYRPLSFLVAAEYIKILGLGRLLRITASIPVRRNGTDVAAFRQAKNHGG